MGREAERNLAKQSWTPGAIAKLCQVAPETVSRWIEGGRLKAFQTAGGHNRVTPKDLVVFLKELRISIPSELAEHAEPVILVVDDDPLVRRIITRTLNQVVPKARIVEAANGFEAGRTLVKLYPRLVILDLHLPGIDGFQICRTIKSDPDFDATKVLAITGLDEKEARPKILAAGADGFLAKPFKTTALAEKLSPLLGLVPDAPNRG